MAKILIIDDSNLSRKTLKKILEEESHTILLAGDGFSALETFAIENPDYVFLDLTMPEINGLDVLKKIKEMNNNAKVIIASADIQKVTQNIAKEFGASGYVTKPFNKIEILSSLNKLIRGD